MLYSFYNRLIGRVLSYSESYAYRRVPGCLFVLCSILVERLPIAIIEDFGIPSQLIFWHLYMNMRKDLYCILEGIKHLFTHIPCKTQVGSRRSFLCTRP